MKFFTCKVCLEKDKRIADLQVQLSRLERFAFPTPTNILPTVQFEADRILSSNQESPDFNVNEDVTAEAVRLLTGTY